MDEDQEGPTDQNDPVLHNDMSGQADTVIQFRDVHGSVVVNAGGSHPSASDDEPPLVATYKLVQSPFPYGFSWIVDIPIPSTELPAPALMTSEGGRRWLDWVDRHRMDRPDHNRFVLTVEGRGPWAVIVEELRIRVVHRFPCEPRGVELRQPELFGTLPARKFQADLRGNDLVVPVPRPTTPSGQVITPDFPYIVHQSDPERFIVDLLYGDEAVFWVAELDWLSGGRKGTMRVGLGGLEFMSTPFQSRPVYTWDVHAERWNRTDTA